MSSLANGRKLTSLDEMFDFNEKEVADEKGNTIFLCPIDKLVEKHNHKFKVKLGKKKDDWLIDSIRQLGVLEPIIIQPLAGTEKYEIIAGHRRSYYSKLAGLNEVPAIIKYDLTEAEAELIETETNLLQRDWEDMSHSERAEVLNNHYNASVFLDVRIGFLEEISEEIKSLANPVESRADSGLSQVETKGNLRDSGKAYELSKDTVARYLRIYTLCDELKARLDSNQIAFMAAFEISYLTPEHQQGLSRLLDLFKLDIAKAQNLRKLEIQGKLNESTMKEVLEGKQIKKPGRPKDFRIKGDIIQRYFKEGVSQSDIEKTIEKALKEYFGKEDSKM